MPRTKSQEFIKINNSIMFRCSIVFLLWLIALCNCEKIHCQSNSILNFGDTVYVNSYRGLKLRDSTDVNSKIIKILDHSTMLVLQDSIFRLNLVIDERYGGWLKVKSKHGVEGYVFSGYLSKIEPHNYTASEFEYNQDLCMNEVLKWILNYLEKDDSLLSTTTKIIENKFSPKYSTSTLYKFYMSGSLVIVEQGYESQYVTLELTDISLNEILNAIEYYHDYGANLLKHDFYKNFEVTAKGDYSRREMVLTGMCQVKLKQSLSRTICEFYLYSL